VEVVVVLRHVSDNAQFVWNGHCQHVLGVEQRWNAEMIAGHIKRLQHRIASSVKVSLTEKNRRFCIQTTSIACNRNTRCSCMFM